MPDEKKPRHPEVNFLPPLDMILSFFKKKDKKTTSNNKPADDQKESEEKAVEKIIEKLNKEK